MDPVIHFVRTRYDQVRRHTLNSQLCSSSIYIEPTGSSQDHPAAEVFHLISRLVQEINNCNQQQRQHSSFLVLGDSGFGKSLLGLELCKLFWDNYKQWGRIPINIDLHEYSTMENLLEQYFCSETIDWQVLRRQKLLLVLDSYDETQVKVNISERQFDGFGWNGADGQFQDVKVVTLCRKQGMSAIRRRQLFSFKKFLPPNSSPAHLEFYMHPFSSTDLHCYLQTFVTQLKSGGENIPVSLQMVKQTTNGTKWEVWANEGSDNPNEYLRWFKILSDLWQLGATPLIFAMILHIMPAMLNELSNCEGFDWTKEKSRELSQLRKLCSTKTGIYDQFSSQWFEFQAKRIWKSRNPFSLFKNIPRDQFPTLCRIYSRNLALSLLRKGKFEDSIQIETTLHWSLMDPVCQPDLLDVCRQNFPYDEDTDQEKCDNLVAIRDACLLQFSNGKCRFSHSSLIPYFASVHLFQTLELVFQMYLDNKLSPVGKETATMLIDNRLYDADILSELANRVHLHDHFAGILLEIVYASKTLPSIATFSSNAITILNAGGYTLSGLDLRDVQIPNANLNNAMLGGSDLRGANLDGVYMVHAYIPAVKLQGANMYQVEFGEIPSIQHENSNMLVTVTSICSGYHNELGREFWYVAFKHGLICRYALETNSPEPLREEPRRLGNKMLVISAANRVVSWNQEPFEDRIMINTWAFEQPEAITDSVELKTECGFLIAEHSNHVVILAGNYLRVWYVDTNSGKFISKFEGTEPGFVNTRRGSKTRHHDTRRLTISYDTAHRDCLICVSEKKALTVLKLNNSTVAQFEPDTKSMTTEFPAQVSCMEFSNSQTIVFGFKVHSKTPEINCKAFRINRDGDLELEECQQLRGHHHPVVNLTRNSTGDKMASCCQNTIITWDITQLPYIPEQCINITSGNSPAQFGDIVFSFSCDSKYLACSFGEMTSLSEIKVYKLHKVHSTYTERLLNQTEVGAIRLATVSQDASSFAMLIQGRNGGALEWYQLKQMRIQKIAVQIIDMPSQTTYLCMELFSDDFVILCHSSNNRSITIEHLQISTGKSTHRLEVNIAEEINPHISSRNTRILISNEHGKLVCCLTKIHIWHLQISPSPYKCQNSPGQADLLLIYCEHGFPDFSRASMAFNIGFNFNWLAYNSGSANDGILVWNITAQSESAPLNVLTTNEPYQILSIHEQSDEAIFLYSCIRGCLTCWKITNCKNVQLVYKSSWPEFHTLGAVSNWGNDRQLIIANDFDSVSLVDPQQQHPRTRGHPQLKLLLNFKVWFDISSHSYRVNSSGPEGLALLVGSSGEHQPACSVRFWYDDVENEWKWKLVWSRHPCAKLTATNSNLTRTFVDNQLNIKLLKQIGAGGYEQICARHLRYNSYASLFTEIVGTTVRPGMPSLTTLRINGESFSISKDNWAIFVVAKLQETETARQLGLIQSHVFFVIEGILNNRRFLIYADYIVEGVRMFAYCDAHNAGQAWARFKSYSSNCKDWQAQSFLVSQTDGLKFINSIHVDKQEYFLYGRFSHTNSNNLSCTEWARRKLIIIDGNLNDSWHNKHCCLPSDLVFPYQSNILLRTLLFYRNIPMQWIRLSGELILDIVAMVLAEWLLDAM